MPEPDVTPRDWPEDFGQENGDYQNRCPVCGRAFRGHKRRVACRACGKPPAPKTDAPDLTAAVRQQLRELLAKLPADLEAGSNKVYMQVDALAFDHLASLLDACDDRDRLRTELADAKMHTQGADETLLESHNLLTAAGVPEQANAADSATCGLIDRIGWLRTENTRLRAALERILLEAGMERSHEEAYRQATRIARAALEDRPLPAPPESP